jgi:hypothetical protein
MAKTIFQAGSYGLSQLNSVLAGTVDSIRASEMPMEAFEAAWTNGAVSLAEHQTAS